ncbi:hypothetical protein ABKN59_005237 [Abortiporus biennis]
MKQPECAWGGLGDDRTTCVGKLQEAFQDIFNKHRVLGECTWRSRDHVNWDYPECSYRRRDVAVHLSKKRNELWEDLFAIFNLNNKESSDEE